MNGEATNAKLVRLRGVALVVGAAGLGVCAVGALVNARQFFFSWLFGYVFWMGLTLGCFTVLMLHHLVGGRWGFVIRRFLEAGSRVLPLMALFFVPVLVGVGFLYGWARPQEVAASETLRHQAGYLNRPAFMIRAGLFFGFWLVIGSLLNRFSVEQDAVTDPAPTRRLRALSGVGLVLHVLVVTFAFIDWVMVLEAQWHSTIFPILTIIGNVMATLALAIVLAVSFRHDAPLEEAITVTHLHHLGNLLQAFMLLWTYMAFSQLLIIYAGNLPHDLTWYLRRIHGGWQWVAVFLAVFHFLVPFGLLLFRKVKRTARSLAAVAMLLLFAHATNDLWLVAPSLHSNRFYVHWNDVAALVGIGGIWFALFCTLLKQKPLLPRNDPRPGLALAHAT
jgi:hypothetical protein